MEVAKGPGGAYWMVMNNKGEVVSTHPTKELALKATGYSERITHHNKEMTDKTAIASKPTTYQNKMATPETMT
jgi:hypothetical protein